MNIKYHEEATTLTPEQIAFLQKRAFTRIGTAVRELTSRMTAISTDVHKSTDVFKKFNEANTDEYN